MPNLLDLTSQFVSATFTRVVQYTNGYFFDGLGNKIPLQNKRGTSLEFTAGNNILAEGEIAYESDTKKIKIGDGITNYNSLSYFQCNTASSQQLKKSVYQQELIGVVNGINTTFTVSTNFLENSSRIFLNGDRLKLGDDYIEVGTNTIIFSYPIFPTDKVILDADVINTGNPTKSVYELELIGVRNGINKAFTTPINFSQNTIRIFLNGIRLKLGDDYTEFDSHTLIFEEAFTQDDNVVIELEVFNYIGSITNLWQQELIGDKDGVNTIFYLENNFTLNSTRLFKNGVRLKLGNDYIESGYNSLILNEPLFETDKINVDLEVYI